MNYSYSTADTTSIIETLYDKITDSDIKMIVYRLLSFNCKWS